MRNLVGLAVLSSDALSSVAYGPEAMLAVLALAGSGALGLSLPIALAIVVLMIAVGVSYRQIIRAYPQGGGSYVVANENLGELPALITAARLLIDYVLTVAVSISAGVAAITSAVPSLPPRHSPADRRLVAHAARGRRHRSHLAMGKTHCPTRGFPSRPMHLDRHA